MLDRNKTVWQRLNDALKEATGDKKQADVLTPLLFPYILEERRDSR